MIKKILAAVIVVSVIGGFVALEAQQLVLTPEEQIQRYRANERAREIAHVGFLKSREYLRRQIARRQAPFEQTVTGHTKGGMYRGTISVSGQEDLNASLAIVSTYNDATHEINATLAARPDSQLAEQEFREWYTARQRPSDR